MHRVSHISMGEQQPVVPVGTGSTVALQLSAHLATEKQREREITLQRGEAGKGGGEGWKAGGRERAPFPLMKSLQHIQCHKSYSTVTQEGSGGLCCEREALMCRNKLQRKDNAAYVTGVKLPKQLSKL